MRIDKFLKVSRIIKRRSVAKDITNQERIYVNDNLAKPSKDVNVGDIVKICFGTKTIVIKIKNVTEYVTKDTATSLYEIISETKTNEA